MKKVLIGKGLIEIAVIVIVVAFFLSLFWPYCGNRARSRQTTCTSNLRQLAMAAMMYSQDNNNILLGLNDMKSKKYVGWVKNLLPNIKGGTDVATPIEMLYCPEVKSDSKIPVSYGYNAALLKPNGMGITENMILQPDKVGVMCDAEPMTDSEGGIIGKATITGIGDKVSKLSVKPVSRHPIGTDDTAIIVGYADGHARSVVGKYDENDKENGVNKAFYRAVELGYIKKAGTKGR